MHNGKHLLICAHFTTPLEQGDLCLALAVLFDELVEKRGDNRALLQGRLAALTGRGHCTCETTASNQQRLRCCVKRGLDPPSRASAGASAGELRARGGAEEGHLQQLHGLCHGQRTKTIDRMTGWPRVRNQAQAEVKLPGLRHVFGVDVNETRMD